MIYKTGISVIIPVYKGEKTIPRLVGQLRQVLKVFTSYEIIMVDDNSPDNSCKIMKELATGSDDITGIILNNNYGQQSATLCGLRHATKDFAVIMDDDLEHNPRDILELYEEIIKGYDVVYALNSNKAESVTLRTFGSRFRDMAFDRLTDKPRDVRVCTFRILNRNTIDEVIKAENRFVYISMEILKHTNNIANISVVYGQRRESGHNIAKLIKLLLKIYVYYSKCRLLKWFRKPGPAYNIKEITGKAAK